MTTLLEILRENWEWRGQIMRIALFDLQKRARGAVFGWAWLLVKPLAYIGVFWFALAVGLRVGSSFGDAGYSYFLWLVTGLVPWFFMSDMISTGTDVLHRYTYLVTKIKFPISAISSVYAISTMVINVILMCILGAVYVAEGMPADVHLLQVPFLMALMLVFWDFASIMTSQLSAISRDFGHLCKAFVQPFFWLSGILFDIDALAETGLSWVSGLMLFNPVAFFSSAMRTAVCDRVWIWERPEFIGAFLLVFLVTVALSCAVYRRCRNEVADVI